MRSDENSRISGASIRLSGPLRVRLRMSGCGRRSAGLYVGSF